MPSSHEIGETRILRAVGVQSHYVHDVKRLDAERSYAAATQREWADNQASM
jgi:hypothetical protein